MKAGELMIGDWVKLKDAKSGNINFVGPTVQIKSITGRHVLVPNAKGLLEDVTEEYLLPIELTPEILEKNGFEKQWQDNYEYYDDDENLNMTFHPKSSNYTNGVYDYIDIEKGCLTINEMPIEFVHELQHALRLCGIEKTIEL